MGIPQFLIIAWYALALGVALANDGKKRDGKYSFWGTLFTYIVLFAVLAWGGFFR